MKSFFLNFEGCMSRKQFWPSFIGGNLLILALVASVFFFGISMVETLEKSSTSGTSVSTRTFTSNENWQKDEFIPDIDIKEGMVVEIERTKRREGEQTSYITKTTITEADGTERTSISHEEFESVPMIAPITQSWGMPVWLQFIILDLCLLIAAITAILLFLNSIRRLRDAGFSPWLMLLILVHGLGEIALLILFCFPTKKKEALEE